MLSPYAVELLIQNVIPRARQSNSDRRDTYANMVTSSKCFRTVSCKSGHERDPPAITREICVSSHYCRDKLSVVFYFVLTPSHELRTYCLVFKHVFLVDS